MVPAASTKHNHVRIQYSHWTYPNSFQLSCGRSYSPYARGPKPETCYCSKCSTVLHSHHASNLFFFLHTTCIRIYGIMLHLQLNKEITQTGDEILTVSPFNGFMPHKIMIPSCITIMNGRVEEWQLPFIKDNLWRSGQYIDQVQKEGKNYINIMQLLNISYKNVI